MGRAIEQSAIESDLMDARSNYDDSWRSFGHYTGAFDGDDLRNFSTAALIGDVGPTAGLQTLCGARQEQQSQSEGGSQTTCLHKLRVLTAGQHLQSSLLY